MTGAAGHDRRRARQGQLAILVAAFLLLLPISGRGDLTAIIALTAYTQVIIFRNVVNGLAGADTFIGGTNGTSGGQNGDGGDRVAGPLLHGAAKGELDAVG